ncbi:MAG: hypothetical protein K9G47_12025, partial [Bacteroidales bacterium]|nr:hypothetical protein [Bacteroidales bacterium]
MKKVFFILFLYGFLFPQFLFSQWQMAEGLEGGRITSMISIDSVLIGVCGKGGGYSGIKGVFADASKNVYQFLEHNGALFCATDQGAFSLDTNGNWTSFNEGLHQREITSIETFEDKIFVTASNELFRSEDGGLNFQKMDHAWGSQIITTDSVFYMIAPHEFKMSWDEGESWQEISDSLHVGIYQVLRYLDINQDYYYLASYQGLFRSVSDSVSWEMIPSMDFNISIVKTIDSTVFAKGYAYPHFYLYYSNDYGETFIEHSDLCDFTKLDQVYYLFRDSILYSEDLGQSWKSFPFIEDREAFCIARQGDSLVMAGGIYYGFDNPIIQLSEDMGENWI